LLDLHRHPDRGGPAAARPADRPAHRQGARPARGCGDGRGRRRRLRRAAARPGRLLRRRPAGRFASGAGGAAGAAEEATVTVTDTELAERVRGLIRDVPDRPKPGILCRDIAPLRAGGRPGTAVIDHLAERYEGRVDVSAGVEARGLLLSAPLAAALGIGSMVVRKA